MTKRNNIKVVKYVVSVVLLVGGMTIFGCKSEGTESVNDGPVIGKTAKAASNVSSETGIAILDEAVRRARVEQRPIYLEFYASWCGPCSVFKSSVLEDRRVKGLLRTRVVFVSADIDTNRALAQKFGVTSVPTGYLLAVDGDELTTLDKHVGSMGKDAFIRFLQQK